jgi:hypothetical protein
MRYLKWVLLGILIGCPLAVACYLTFGSKWLARHRELAEERHSVEILSRAKTVEELEMAVGGLGVMLRLKDGAWIAIRYWDSHGGTIASSAVARDSAGNWFRSNVHFCGRFQYYRHLKEAVAKDDPLASNYKETLQSQFANLLSIEDGASVEDAHQTLLAMGFSRFAPPERGRAD